MAVNKDTIKYYCVVCAKMQHVIIEPLDNGCGDIICKECCLVIATRSIDNIETIKEN